MKNQTTNFTSLKIKDPILGLGKKIAGDTPDTGTLTLAEVSAEAETNIINNPKYDSNKAAGVNNSKIRNGTMFFSSEDKAIVYYADNDRKKIGMTIVASGNATLNGLAGTVVACSIVTENSNISVTGQTDTAGPLVANTVGSIRVGKIVAGVSFTVFSTLDGETNNFTWAIIV